MNKNAGLSKHEGGSAYWRVALVVVFCLLLLSGASAALAAVSYPFNPSPDGVGTVGSVIDPTTGGSRWWYRDRQDGSGMSAGKNEGAYAVFDTTATVATYKGSGTGNYNSQGGAYNLTGGVYGDGTATNDPHGGYSSTTNKCKVCHAVHRAEGAYYLLRGMSQDDACDYCHIGGSAHSRKIVYDYGVNGKYTTNGHTIGASSIIPDSSVKEWLQDVTINTVEEDMDDTSTVVQVRKYYERRNKMFRFARHHGQVVTMAAGVDTSYSRVGPLALRCMNCHQPHNAKHLIWKPRDIGTTTQLTNGYKLLRLSPSGSIEGATTVITADSGNKTANEAMEDRLAVTAGNGSGVGPGDVVKVPEETSITANNTGRVGGGTGEGGASTGYHTIWTTWPSTAHDRYGSAMELALQRDPSLVNQFALSVWCADCHNLNIGYWQQTGTVFGGKSHSERTHPAPFVGAGMGAGQCYSCHRNDMPLTYGGANEAPCEQCHFGTQSYKGVRVDAEALSYYARYDFPHSGGARDIKMLGTWTAYPDSNDIMQTKEETITANNLDAVCMRCHPGIGTNH